MHDREQLGRIVRQVWSNWAKEQPNAKPSWLVPWEELNEPDREVDRRIGEEIARVVSERLTREPDEAFAELPSVLGALDREAGIAPCRSCDALREEVEVLKRSIVNASAREIAMRTEVEQRLDMALRFELDKAGIERREQEAVELVNLRAEVESLKQLNDPESVQHWDTMRAERDQARKERDDAVQAAVDAIEDERLLSEAVAKAFPYVEGSPLYEPHGPDLFGRLEGASRELKKLRGRKRRNVKDAAAFLRKVQRSIDPRDAGTPKAIATGILTALEERDLDWIRAMIEALGAGSGFRVPVVPEADAFRQLFESVEFHKAVEAAYEDEPTSGSEGEEE